MASPSYIADLSKGGHSSPASEKRGKHDDLFRRLSEVEDATQTFHLPLCGTCATQTSYNGPDLDITSPDTDYKCPICEDPRQYIGPAGQTWTTLPALINDKEQGYHNSFLELVPGQVWAFETAPKFGIGQRAFLIKDEKMMETGNGLVMWDCVAYLDDETLARIEELSEGQGIAHIVVSHPHYFSTTALWAAAFPKAKLWLAKEDFHDWYQRKDVVQGVESTDSAEAVKGSQPSAAKQIRLVEGVRTRLSDASDPASLNFTILLLGGHFPGSLVLLWKNILFTADTIQVVPSGLYKSDQPKRDDVASVTFLWSYPNQIPLNADEIEKVCQPLEEISFDIILGAFDGFNIWGDAKKKVFQSRDIFLSRLGRKA